MSSSTRGGVRIVVLRIAKRVGKRRHNDPAPTLALYEYGDGNLSVMIMPDPPHRGIWVRSRKKFEALGMTITQNGDQEGAAVFDPADHQQTQAAIEAIQAKKVRTLSPERRAELVAAGHGTRLKPGHMAQNALQLF